MMNENDQIKKFELFKQFHILHLRKQTIEKDIIFILNNKIPNFSAIISSIQLENASLDLKRFNECDNISNKITNLRKFIYATDNCYIDEINSENKDLKIVEPNLNTIKKEVITLMRYCVQNFEALNLEKNILLQELDSFNKYVDSWNPSNQFAKNTTKSNNNDRSVQYSSSFSSNTSSDLLDDSLPLEVIQFDKFIEEKGGKFGGWNETDHLTFLKYRNKYKGRSIFIQEANINIYSKSIIEIEEHDKWYNKYNQLLLLKKKTILKWKENKITGEKSNPNLKTNLLKFEIENINEKPDFLARDKAKMDKWKTLKEFKIMEKKESDIKKMILKRNRLEEKQIEQAVTRIMVEEYKRKKIEELKNLEENEKEKQVQLKMKQLQANMFLMNFRNKGIDKVRNINEKRNLQKFKCEDEKQKRLEKIKSQVEINVKRDPSRLFKTKTIWKNSKPKCSTFINDCSVDYIQHRLIPNWRQGL